MPEAIRILHVFASVNRGGAESRTMDLYRHIDREKVQFDFLINAKEVGHYETEILKMGGRIYRIPRFLIYNYFSYRKAVRDFFHQHHDFHMIQGHLTSSAKIYLPEAKKAGIPTTIAHSRNASAGPGLKGFLTRFLHCGLNKKADYLFACSKIAGIDVFGKKAWDKGQIHYVPNAIEVAKFDYNENKREEFRNKLELNGQFVIGHVGRFDYQKNHRYLLKIFYEVQKVIPDTRLLLIGGGDGKDDFCTAALELGIAEKIIFAGVVENPWDYYQAMDYFVFPSHFEGLPGVLVEAQASGLKCLISDTIAGEIMITDMIKAMDIRSEPMNWANYIIESRNYIRGNMAEKIKKAGFDADKQAKKMEEFYLTGNIAPQKANRKKIFLISPTLCQGGFERICVKTARLLTPYYDVVIVLFDSSNIAFDVSGLDIIDIRQSVKHGNIAKMINIIIRTIKVRLLKRSHKPVITYSFGATANIVNSLSKTRKCKVWLSLHSYMDMGEEAKLRLFMRKADLLICCSKFIAAELKEKYNYEKAITLYNPYDVDEMKKLADSEEPEWPWTDEGEKLIHIMSMGREDDVKGFWHTINVFYLINSKLPQTRLTIIGDGTFTEYKYLAEKMGMLDKVFFSGMQKNPYKYLKKGTIYLLNSLNEGFPNALIEAMAMGMVPIACDCRTGPAEILLENDLSEDERNLIYHEEHILMGDYGILVPVMDEPKCMEHHNFTNAEHNMALCATKLLRDSESLAKYQKAATKRADVFTGEKYLKHVLSLIADC